MKNVKVSTILAGLRVNEMDYTDLLCWLSANGSEGWDLELLLMKLSDYVRFYMNDEEEDMHLQVVDSESVFNGAIDGIEIEEENFISATINDTENEMILRLKDCNSNKVKAYVLAVA